MSFYSKEFIECRTAIENAKNHNDILVAVDILDEKWQMDNSIMNDKDWPKLTDVIGTKTEDFFD